MAQRWGRLHRPLVIGGAEQPCRVGSFQERIALRFGAIGSQEPSSPSALLVRKRQWTLVLGAWVVLWLACIVTVEGVAAKWHGKNYWYGDAANNFTFNNPGWCESQGADLTNFIIESSNARSDYR